MPKFKFYNGSKKEDVWHYEFHLHFLIKRLDKVALGCARTIVKTKFKKCANRNIVASFVA